MPAEGVMARPSSCGAERFPIYQAAPRNANSERNSDAAAPATINARGVTPRAGQDHPLSNSSRSLAPYFPFAKDTN
jgi:hypothetical protein